MNCIWILLLLGCCGRGNGNCTNGCSREERGRCGCAEEKGCEKKEKRCESRCEKICQEVCEEACEEGGESRADRWNERWDGRNNRWQENRNDSCGCND